MIYDIIKQISSCLDPEFVYCQEGGTLFHSGVKKNNIYIGIDIHIGYTGQ